MNEPSPPPIPTADPLPPPVPKLAPVSPNLPMAAPETPPVPYSNKRANSVSRKWNTLAASLLFVVSVSAIGYFARHEIQSIVAGLQTTVAVDAEEQVSTKVGEKAIPRTNKNTDTIDLLSKVVGESDQVKTGLRIPVDQPTPSSESSSEIAFVDGKVSKSNNKKAAMPSPQGSMAQAEIKGSNFSTSRVAISQHRQIAEWVISKGGSLSVLHGGTELQVKSKGSLPNGLFEISKINFEHKGIRDDDLHRLVNLKQLRSINLMWTQITDAAFLTLGQIESLEEINVAATSINGNGFRFLEASANLHVLLCGGCQSINDGSLAHLANVPELKTLGLIDTRISDDALTHVAKINSLETLNLAGIGFTLAISDSGLRHLHALKSLVSLNVEKTQVTSAGVRSFKQAVPNCFVKH